MLFFVFVSDQLHLLLTNQQPQRNQLIKDNRSQTYSHHKGLADVFDEDFSTKIKFVRRLK